MVRELIILFSFLVIFSYVLDVICKEIKVPSVIFLIALGIIGRVVVDNFHIKLPVLTPVLMTLGGISLILVVLQGAMELQWSPEKNRLIFKMLLLCVFPMLTLAYVASYGLSFYIPHSFHRILVNVIPFAIISSAIAIPATGMLAEKPREQIVYESSFSDILGLLFFNFIFTNSGGLLHQVGVFSLELLGTIVLTLLGTLLIAWLLGFLPDGVRLIPILAALVFVFEIAEYFELPALIFIFVFGVFLGNLSKFSKYHFLKYIHPERIKLHFDEFYNIVSEVGFLVRSVFFLMLGFFILPSELLNLKALLWSCGILALSYLIRYCYLRLLRVTIFPNLFYSPRGLVTILLFLYIPLGERLPQLGISVVIQVVILSTLIMAIGGKIVSSKSNEPTGKEVQDI